MLISTDGSGVSMSSSGFWMVQQSCELCVLFILSLYFVLKLSIDLHIHISIVFTLVYIVKTNCAFHARHQNFLTIMRLLRCYACCFITVGSLKISNISSSYHFEQKKP